VAREFHEAVSIRKTIHAVMFIACALAAGCASTVRPDRSLGDLFAARQAEDARRVKAMNELLAAFLERIEAKAAAASKNPRGTPATIDLLVISGGGDWGAFGAGVLKGWGRVAGDLARPKFDVVTGVSTGAMIAPFAFLGDDESIERIVKLYRNPQKDWTASRGLVFFLPNNPSFFALPGLEREMRSALDRRMLERIAAEGTTGRSLLVNTTNIDLGEMRAWDIVAEAKTALASNNEEHVYKILLASAGIPAVFPARSIGDYLYVDGAITGNILYRARAREEETIPARWAAKHPKLPMPRLRYWVIFNNQFRFPPQVTQDRWPDIMSRAMIMSTQTSTINSIRHLYALAEIARLKYRADVEVRVMAVPDSWVPPKPGTFDPEVMNELADLGEKMGADPTSWRTNPP
jgi:predicted acylesterase/phospholipase RssA